MKSIILILSIFLASTVQAKVPVHVCGFGEVTKVAMKDGIGSTVSMMPLLIEEKSYLESEMDNKWDCDEGVDLLGAGKKDFKGKNQVVLNAMCSKDSMRIYKVELVLDCQEAYLD